MFRNFQQGGNRFKVLSLSGEVGEVVIFTKLYQPSVEVKFVAAPNCKGTESHLFIVVRLVFTRNNDVGPV